MANDLLYTPPEIFETLNTTFDVDVCAPTGGIDWIPAKRFIDEKEDGLCSEWHGVVWMNPPYSKPRMWIDKWLEHKNGFALILYAKSKWFEKLWDSQAKGVMLDSSMKFMTPAGDRHSILMPVALWAIGIEPIKILEDSNFGKVR